MIAGAVSSIRVTSPAEAWTKAPENIKAGIVEANLRSFSVDEMPSTLEGLVGYTTVTFEYSWHDDSLHVVENE